MAGATKVALKLLIDKVKKRVVLAESESDFVDILFSCLTLPMGTIIRLLGKQSNLGCFDKLYESVENLDTKHLQTEACKTMLLRPLSAAEDPCDNLVIQVDDTQPRRGYLCSNEICRNGDCILGSTVQNTRCHCGAMMNKEVKSLFKGNCTELDRKTVFVKGNVRFLIGDNLQVMPVTTEAINFLLNKLGVDSGTIFEEQMVEFGRAEVLNLLKCSLQSSTPLTDVFMPNPKCSHVVKLVVKDEIEAHDEKEVKMEAKRIKVKIFLSKSDNKVLYSEAGEDFADLLFSLLVLPLGSIVKYLAGNSSIGSIDNLYKSVEDLKVGECMITEDCKSMLLSPKLASYFGCDNQLIQTTAVVPYTAVVYKCYICSSFHSDASSCCGYKRGTVKLTCSDPKNFSPFAKSEGSSYAKGPAKFMITDEMVVGPLSLMTIMNSNQLKKPDFVVQEKEVCLGKTEMLALLRATLSTRTALTSAFSQKRKKRRFE